jgi:hypothetical protein
MVKSDGSLELLDFDDARLFKDSELSRTFDKVTALLAFRYRLIQ